MTGALDKVLSDAVQPGLYQLDMSLRPGTICHRAVASGFACFYIDGAAVFDKQSLLEQAAEAMSFPEYFGHNWDALEECINDLSWIDSEAYMLVYDHVAVLAGQHAQVAKTFLTILNRTVQEWGDRSRPFYVLLRNTGALPVSVPELE